MINLRIPVFALALLVGVFLSLAGESEPEYRPSIIQIADDAAIEQLESQGVVVWHHRGDMVLALVPVAQTRDIRKMRGVRHVERDRYIVQAMDTARTMFGADRIGKGEDLPMPYDGTGVVVGLCDIGLDPNHIAFKDAQGNSRVKKIASFNELRNERVIVTEPDEIAAWTTDTPDNYHGTHVANIMAGSYKANNLYGMAPGADIVMTSSLGYDMGLLSGCEEILAYAKSVGKPAVINLSFSSYTGPKDGTSLFCRYLELLGQEAIVCLAAGNTGGSRVARRIDFTPGYKWRGRIVSDTGLDLMGFADAWSDDARPINACVFVYRQEKEDNGEILTPVYEGVVNGEKGPFRYLLSSRTDPEFAKYMSGEVLVEGYVNHLNGRWVTEVSYNTSCAESMSGECPDSPKYTLVVEYSADPGVHADICIDCQYSRFSTIPGYYNPQSVFSISDLCTGHNVVSVGMYNSSRWIKTLGGLVQKWNEEVPSTNALSSYGTLRDGRVMPIVCAPGSPIVSACSRYFLQKYPGQEPDMSAKATVGGETYHWNICAGTSMASPYVAGVVACWAQAIPDLTVEDVKDALGATNVRDYDNEPADPHDGCGWLSPYEALKHLIKEAGVTAGSVDGAAPAVVIRGDVAEIFNPRGGTLHVAVYDMTGVRRMSVVSDEPVSEVALDSLEPGVYSIVISKSAGCPVCRKFIR